MFFNSTATDRRRHQASDMADYWSSFLSTGLISWDGEPLLEVTAEGTNRNVSLSIGRAVMKGHLYLNKAIKDLPIDGPDPTLDRIDRLVLRFDNTIENRYIKSFIIKGEPSANPEPPELERTYLEGEPLVYEISLAQIRVVAGKSFIEQEDIIDERLDESVCGLASSLVGVPTDVFMQEWEEWFEHQQTEGFVMADEKGSPEGVATLDGAGTIPLSQLHLKVPKFTYSTSRPPNSSDNRSNGYLVGSRWTYRDTPLEQWEEYVCIQSSQSSAQWERIILTKDNYQYYINGNENEEVSGGWQQVFADGTNSLNRYSDRLRLYCIKASSSSRSSLIISTSKKIDLSKIDKIYVDWGNSGTNVIANQSRFVVSEEELTGGYSDGVAKIEVTQDFSRNTQFIDVSSLKGEYYLNIYVAITGTNNRTSTLNIYRIWGEE